MITVIFNDENDGGWICHSGRSEESGEVREGAVVRFFTSLRSVQNDIEVRSVRDDLDGTAVAHCNLSPTQ